MNPTIILPFPNGKLSGHAFGNWRSKASPTAKARALAKAETEQAGQFTLPPEPQDIEVAFHFYPPDLRGDRVNYPNRLKAYIDGIAEALGFNDKRILPSYHFHPVDRKNGRVEVVIATRVYVQFEQRLFVAKQHSPIPRPKLSFPDD